MGIIINGEEYITSEEVARLVGLAECDIWSFISTAGDIHIRNDVRYYCKRGILEAFKKLENMLMDEDTITCILKNIGLSHFIALNELFGFDNNFPKPMAYQWDGGNELPLRRVGDVIAWVKTYKNDKKVIKNGKDIERV